ncbi:hypothetical protein [Endozoicomonas sp. 4G]|uniref:hypothetical protein n=1 Tax=Endozoicomonas sp. 4G TaxID=2872754 RepID=UPI0020786080|nr:hypothetical protein [Endozoicomonas sp. 4G]
MTPRQFKIEILLPGLHVLHGIGGPPIRDAALQMLLTIALQESALEHRAQVIASGNPAPRGAGGSSSARAAWPA